MLWIAAALAAWLGRRPTHIVILPAAAFAVTATYLIAYRTPPGHSDPAEFLSHLVATLAYVLAYLGGPWGLSAGWLLDSNPITPAMIAGTAGLVIFAALGLQLLIDRRRHAPQAGVPFALAGVRRRGRAHGGPGAVRLEIDTGRPAPDRVTLCVWTEDAVLGRHLLTIPSRPELCPADGR